MESLNTTSETVTDMEILKKMEDEHLRLQRLVRLKQTARQERTMGVPPQFRQQDQLMRTLKKEYINLRKDLKIARSGAHKKKDKKMHYELQKALLLRVQTEIECDDGVTVMKQSDDLFHRNNKNQIRLRKLFTASTGQINERRIQSENRLVSTENVLEAVTRKFDVIQCENKKLRQEIEHLLNDRARFNQGWTKMLNALTKGKKFLTDLFESSTLAYDQRDEWCAKLKSVQEKGKMDQSLQLQEMRELQKAFDHEMKVFNFLAKKGVMRINVKQEEREELEREKMEEDLREKTEEHIKILNKIFDYTEETKIEKIIESFKQNEHENFSIYELLTGYCAENEVLSREVNKLQQQVCEYQNSDDRRDWNEMMDVKREAKIASIHKMLKEQKARREEAEKRLEAKTALLNDAMDKIGGLFRMLECSLEPFQNLLGDKQPSIWQLDLTLRLITEKIENYVEMVYYCEHHISKKPDKSTSRLKKYTIHIQRPQCWKPIPINMLVPADPCPNCVETRWLSRFSDTDEMPLTHAGTLAAISELSEDPTYVRSDRIHLLTDCKVPRSRVILANRYMNQ